MAAPLIRSGAVGGMTIVGEGLSSLQPSGGGLAELAGRMMTTGVALGDRMRANSRREPAPPAQRPKSLARNPGSASWPWQRCDCETPRITWVTC